MMLHLNMDLNIYNQQCSLIKLQFQNSSSADMHLLAIDNIITY